MLKRDRDRFMDRTMAHKYNLIHNVQQIGEPALSGLYLKSFYNTSKRYRLQLPEAVRGDNAKFCGNCGCVRIAGYNTTMTLYSETEDNETASRKLKYTCLHCEYTHVFPIEKFSTTKDSFADVAAAKVTMEWPKQAPNDEKVKKKSSAKERAKKRKQSTLSSLLANKKEKEESNKGKLSLSLMDFMK